MSREYEVRLLEVGIRRTERRLREFETAHRMTTKEFVRRFENDELDETLELAEWIGEYRLLQRLNEKTQVSLTKNGALRKPGSES